MTGPLFLSYWFVIFLGVTLPLYWLVQHARFRLILLLVSCAVFHTHFAGPAGVLPIVVLAAVTYGAGRMRNFTVCVLAIALCASSLIYYKYTQFICAQAIGAILPNLARAVEGKYHDVLAPIPPLAISFFVFEFIHYLVDVLRGGPSIKSGLGFSLFSIFWPSIVAGPVKRYPDFLAALEQGAQSVNSRDVAAGIVRVALGLLKKIIADNLTAFVTFHGQRFEDMDILWRWFVVICLALRILLDFSGYSDMAIGFARMHGIRLPENFNWPYLATSITVFWQRWHISLSLWIRDYIYITMGGGRHGIWRKIGNGLLAFAICGLWHGAGWNFLCWGLYHGIGLAISSNYRAVLGRFGEALAVRLERNHHVAWGMTMLFVGVGWLFFFYPLPRAFTMLTLLFGVS
jgi:alginate O-acetyltransferase complex protein AlgI